jgi:hypothetical protein
MEIQTFRLITKSCDFGSPTWNVLSKRLANNNVYYFLTDPYDDEKIAVKVFRKHIKLFLEIVNEGGFNAKFKRRELPDRCLM